MLFQQINQNDQIMIFFQIKINADRMNCRITYKNDAYNTGLQKLFSSKAKF